MTAPGGATRAPGRVERDPFLDNAKILLIVLVVIGHNWYPAIDDFRVLKAAYMVVYSFHVPAFVLLCGYFSRGFEGRPAQWRKLLTTVLVPYLIFQTAYAAVSSAVAHEPFTLHFSSPIYVCWFLLALFVWRASTPLLRSVPHPVLVSFAISLAAGVTVVDTGYALSRVLQLLPWFVVGLVLQPRHLQLLQHRRLRLPAAVVMVAAAVGAYVLAPSIDVRWLDREWDAKALGASVPLDLATSLAIDVLTAVMIAAAFCLVPRGRSWLTRLGALTMYPFLLHGLIVRVLQYLGVHRSLIGVGALGVVAITVGAIALALLLTTPAVRWLTRWAVEPAAILARFARRREPAEGAAPATAAADPAGPADALPGGAHASDRRPARPQPRPSGSGREAAPVRRSPYPATAGARRSGP